MVVFAFHSTVWSGQDRLDIGIRDLEICELGGRQTLLAMTGPDGGAASWQLSQGHAAVLADTHIFTTTEGLAADGEMYITPSGAVAIGNHSELIGLEINAQGGIAARLSWGALSSEVGNLRALVASGHNLVYLAGDSGEGIHSYRFNGDGTVSSLGQLTGTSSTYLEAVIDLDTAVVAGQEYLLATDRAGRGVSSFRVDLDSGTLEPRGMIGAAQGLGIMEPVALETVVIGNLTYAVLASAGHGGGALSVMRLHPSGRLEPIDHILDTRSTRFGQVQDLAVTVVGDRAYVVAGGGDDGLSLFLMLPSGRLMHLQSVAVGEMTGLSGINALESVLLGNEIQIFIAGSGQAGIGQLAVSLAQQGISHMGTAAGDTLSGSDGDDILIGGDGDDYLTAYQDDDILVDGQGRDTLIGGAGADVYVLLPDGDIDQIREFDPGIDRLDLSSFPMLYDPSQLEFTSRADGAVLTWRDEVTEVLSLSGGRLSLSDIFGLGFEDIDRPALGTGERLIGGEGADELGGNWGGDHLEGREGNDRLLGGGGADSLFGGVGFDTLFGGGGDDQLWGGNGRDRVYMGDGDDLYSDNAQEGELGRDTVFGGFGRDTIQGGAGNDHFYGMDGDDLILARLGDDWLFGGVGFDTLFGGSGDDRIWGGNGRDRVYMGDGDDLYSDNAQEGELGRDTVFGGFGRDTIQGGAGNDHFYGMDGDDVIFARLGDDWLFGGAGKDQLNGGAGRDWLFAGGGADTLTGGAGADVFVFASDQQIDWITDFSPGEDRVRLIGTGLTYDDLRVSQEQSGTRIEIGTDVLFLEGISSFALHNTDFVFV